MKNNTIYEKTYLAGKKNKWNAILNFVFIALCIVYYFIISATTNNEGGDLGTGIGLAVRVVFCLIALFVAGGAFFINGVASAFIASKMIKMSQGEKITTGVYIVSIIIKIIVILALLVAAGMMTLYGFLIASFVGDLLFAILLVAIAIYQIVLIVQEQKSRKEIKK